MNGYSYDKNRQQEYKLTTDVGSRWWMPNSEYDHGGKAVVTSK